MRENLVQKSWKMAGRKHTAEQIIAVLRQVEVALGNGKTNPQACRAEAGITEQTYYRGRNLTAG
jgi:putative transposase